MRRPAHFEVLGFAGYPETLLGLELPLHLAGEALQGHLERIETLLG